MAHKYDEFFRLLVDAHVVTGRAVREAEALGLKSTLDEIKDLYNGLVKISNNVMTKIESDHIAKLIDNSGAPPLTSAPAKRKFGQDAWPQAAMTPQFMYLQINEERNCNDPTDPPAAAEGFTCPAPDPASGPTE
jgi:hypothetical protein